MSNRTRPPMNADKRRFNSPPRPLVGRCCRNATGRKYRQIYSSRGSRISRSRTLVPPHAEAPQPCALCALSWPKICVGDDVRRLKLNPRKVRASSPQLRPLNCPGRAPFTKSPASINSGRPQGPFVAKKSATETNKPEGRAPRVPNQAADAPTQKQSGPRGTRPSEFRRAAHPIGLLGAPGVMMESQHGLHLLQ